MGYTAHELARLSGVSVRTLHYYEEQGLLHPARRPNGYRDYGPADVRRLQQVLLFRQADMPLADIRRILHEPPSAQTDALRAQLGRLRAERRRLDGLIATVESMIAETEAIAGTEKAAGTGALQETVAHIVVPAPGQHGADPTMTGCRTNTRPAAQPKRQAERKPAMETKRNAPNAPRDAARFEALKQQAIAENERLYGTETRATYGDQAVDTVNERVATMSEDQWQSADDQQRAIGAALARIAAAGDPEASARGEAGRELFELHRAWLLNYWTPAMYTPAAHRGLAQTYTEDARFAAVYEAMAPNGARILRTAIEAWADRA